MGHKSNIRRALLALGLAISFLIAPGTIDAPRSFATSPVLFGAYAKPRISPYTNKMETKTTAVTDMEQEIGRQLDVVRVFDNWDSPFPDSFTNNMKTYGNTISLSVKTKLANGTAVSWQQIADAINSEGQVYPTLYAQAVKWANEVNGYGVHMYFIFNHEPEAKASASSGDATAYIAAWQAMYNLFHGNIDPSIAATNAEWAWTMTDYSFLLPPNDPQSPSRPRYALDWYPGNAYVDDIAADVYNWSDCRYVSSVKGPKNAWKSLENLAYSPGTNLGGVVNFANTVNANLVANGQTPKGLILMEWGSVENDTSAPGTKASWFSDADSALKGSEWSYLKAILYFNTVDGTYNKCQWWVDTEPGTTTTGPGPTLSAFQAMAADPYFRASGS